MRDQPVCPVCRGEVRLWAEGNVSARQFFSAAEPYAIAAGARLRLPIYVCVECGHGMSPLDVDPGVVAEWYAEAKLVLMFLAGERARRLTARAVLRRMASLRHVPGSLLDVGAGPGIFVSEAARAGWQAYGLEPAAWAVHHGRDAFNVSMIKGDLLSPLDLPGKPFNVVTMFDVVEHAAEPLTLLRSAATVLRPGGLLVLTTPRFDSLLARILGRHWYCIFPAHLQYFTSNSLQLALAAAGFDVVKRLGHTRCVSWQYGWRRLCAWLVDGAWPASSRGARAMSIPVNFGDEFEVYARKR